MLEPNNWLSNCAPGFSQLESSERRAVTDFVMVWSLYEAQVLNCRASADGMLAKIDEWNAATPMNGIRSDAS